MQEGMGKSWKGCRGTGRGWMGVEVEEAMKRCGEDQKGEG